MKMTKLKTGSVSLKQFLGILLSVLALQVFAQQFNGLISAGSVNSQLSFSGEHAGMPFEGKFNDWEASLILPPADTPMIKASFDLRSAKTGDRTYDTALQEGDWFDVENTPTANFSSSNVSLLPSGKGYLVKGDLILRGVVQTLEFELLQNSETLTATISVDRLVHKIGFESDPEAEWVSRDIELSLLINLGE